MSILYYLLIIVGSIIGGFTIGFIVFYIFIFFKDWRVKRKTKRLTDVELAKPPKTERGDISNERKFDLDFREFEKLRSAIKGERRTIPTTYDTSNNRGIEGRGEIQSNSNSYYEPTLRENKGSDGEFEIY